MIRDAIADDNIVLSLKQKARIIMLRICVSIGMVWFTFAMDTTDHTCREMQLRGRLSFSKRLPGFQDGRNCMTRGWKRSTQLHIFFANETWFASSHCCWATLPKFSVMKGESISPRTMNTDTVECFFGDARQMLGGSSNKLTAAGFDRVDKKASMFNHARFSLVGNNSTGHNVFGRNKRF
jgi:hypothetical protein